MKVLHLASFSGNAGDCLNHKGFRPWFETFFSEKVQWVEFEIRDVYRKYKNFEDDLLVASKNVDLLVIGGGNYLELWPENSSTGTSLDLTDKFLAELDTPIFFNALGVDDGQGIGSSARLNFEKFILRITAEEKYLVSIRNDGSMSALTKHLGMVPNVHQIPDHGFFGEKGSPQPPRVQSEGFTVGINLAVDMKEVRFENFSGVDEFISEIAECLEAFHELTNCKFKFFPHVMSDLVAASNLLMKLPDRIARDFFEVSKLSTARESCADIFKEYDECNLVIANRFHSNVYAIRSGIPVIGLSNYPQIVNLYKELNYLPQCVDVSFPGFSGELLNCLVNTSNDANSLTSGLNAVNGELFKIRQEFEMILREWLVDNGFPSC